MKLKRRGNGYYYIYYDRRTVKSLGTKDKVLAAQYFKDEKVKARKGELAQLDKVRRIRLGEFMAEYLAERNQLLLAGEISKHTYRADDLALRRLLDMVGDIPLRLVENHVKAFKSKILAGASDIEKRKNTINTYLRHLSSAFSWAASEDRQTGRPAYIERNPFAETRTSSVKFKGIRKLPRYLSIEEIVRVRWQLVHKVDELEAALVTAVGGDKGRINKSLASWRDFAPLMEIYLYTGMRVAELTRLDWHDVRLEDGAILIRKPKDREERMVAIPAMLEAILRDMGPQDLGRVCRFSEGHISRMFKKLARAAGLDESKNLKSLRHSYGTLAADAGMNLDVIKENMGHASVKTTEIYKKVLVERQKKQSKLLDFGG